ncbi:hypothetical protein ADUPG1_011535, partial [Aduncisulcus paluster]
MITKRRTGLATNISIPFSSSSPIQSHEVHGAYICLNGDSLPPSHLIFNFISSKGDKTPKKYEFPGFKGYYWYFLPVDLPDVVLCEITGKGRKKEYFKIQSLVFIRKETSEERKTREAREKLWSEAPIVNSVFVKEGGGYSSPIPRDDPKLVDLSIPIVKCNSARFTKESELYDQSSNAQRMLKGGEFVVFSDLYIPFSSPSTMKGAYICVHRNWSSPTLLFSFTDCDGKKTFKKYEFTRPKHWYEWHFLPIDLPNVISCEIEGKGTWYENNGLVYSIAGLIFDTTNLRRLFRTSLTHKFSTSKIFPPKIVKRIRHRAVEVSRHVA